MNSNIIQLEEVDHYKSSLGNKTLNLKKCADWGFNVPSFVALPSHISKTLLADTVFRKKISQESAHILKKNRYAVRSSAIIEDNANQSYAGQFLTKTNLAASELERAIYQVIKQADFFLNGDIGKFSLIIQEYIDADISGVTFTRNPSGAREMVIEYASNEGEQIVSGKVKPSKISFYWNDQTIKLPKPFGNNKIVEKFKQLENKNNFPQDIEWCIKNHQFYLLQTRPITTISQKQYDQILFLENTLPKNKKYFFEKTEISEFAPKPTTTTYDLLNFIYQKNGPVDKVYKKYGIDYQETNFLKIIGNELFVDKEKEIQGILPAYSYLHGKDFTPKFNILLNLSLTIKNLFFFNRIKTNDHKNLFKDLKIKIKSGKTQGLSLKAALNNFLCDYELIFKINLLSGLSFKKVNSLIRNEPINFSEILGGYSYFVNLAQYHIKFPIGLKGNSLELSDETDFTANINAKHEVASRIINWWKKIPEYKKKMMQGIISEALVYNRLRELGRWLAIKNINILRISLLNYAEKKGFKSTANIYFTGFDSILNDKIDESSALKNKNAYEKNDHFNLTNAITSSLIIKKSKTLGVSSGLAIGRLETLENIKTKINSGKKIILYTEILSPELTKYFDKISGIISNNGGLLSHLSIMARENNIPVVVGYSMVDGKFKLGDYVQIDGSTGEIIKIKTTNQ